jgi:hypothetical protein
MTGAESAMSLKLSSLSSERNPRAAKHRAEETDQSPKDKKDDG